LVQVFGSGLRKEVLNKRERLASRLLGLKVFLPPALNLFFNNLAEMLELIIVKRLPVSLSLDPDNGVAKHFRCLFIREPKIVRKEVSPDVILNGLHPPPVLLLRVSSLWRETAEELSPGNRHERKDSTGYNRRFEEANG
jgi:hypothetical protein